MYLLSEQFCFKLSDWESLGSACCETLRSGGGYDVPFQFFLFHLSPQSSAECDIFPWRLIHRTLLLILCTEFSCCVIWGQSPPTACQPEYTPSNTASAAEKWGKGGGNEPDKQQASQSCLANFWLSDIQGIFHHLSLCCLSTDWSNRSANNSKKSTQGTFFSPFFRYVKSYEAAVILNQTVGH